MTRLIILPFMSELKFILTRVRHKRRTREMISRLQLNEYVFFLHFLLPNLLFETPLFGSKIKGRLFTRWSSF